VFPAAKAIADHLRDWYNGIPEDEFVCMGVKSDETYGIPKDIVVSMPVRCPGGLVYKVVSDIQLSEVQKGMIDKSNKDLLSEVKCLELAETKE